MTKRKKVQNEISEKDPNVISVDGIVDRAKAKESHVCSLILEYDNLSDQRNLLLTELKEVQMAFSSDHLDLKCFYWEECNYWVKTTIEQTYKKVKTGELIPDPG